MMVTLPEVTLCCVDALNHSLALRALRKCRQSITFARTLFFTDAIPHGLQVPSDIEVISTGPIASHETYSRIVLKGLFPHIATSHLLLVQWDGYVVHAERWQPAFLECDYIGAPWPNADGKLETVGNGGFSLRSRRLLAILQEDTFPLVTNTEDVTICGVHRQRLESEFDVRFASTDLAKQFSFEMSLQALAGGAKTFGFHGIFNLFLVESPSEIAQMAEHFPDHIARSTGVNLLLKNLVEFDMWRSAVAVGRRILRASPENEEVATLVVYAQEKLAQTSASGSRPQTLIGRLAHRLRRL